MLDSLLESIFNFVQSVILSLGSWGIALFMAIESCNIPIPSEAIMPFAGYLVSIGKMNFHVAAWMGALGCLLGSIPSYYIGYFGGRPFFEKYGKYILVSKKDLDDADKWVDKYGDWAFFLCRMLPVIRTFISLPAGILKARKRIFFSLTFLGSLIWCYALVYVGVQLGEHLDKLKSIWHKFDVVIILACLILGCLYIYKHVKHLKES